ncbi:MAG: PD-(D/E)XK nuclease family protein [Methylotenera sp.]
MSSLAESPVILCATTRLARSLQMTMQASLQQNGKTQWQAAAIYTLSDWLNNIIENAILLGEIEADNIPTEALSAMQEAMLWEQSIQQSLKSYTAAELFDTTGLASAAIEANRLITEWRLNIDLAQASEETQQFMQWREDFQARCKANNVLEAVRYEAWQINCLARDAGQLPNQIALAGFDRLHPHTKRLITVLEKRGVTVNHYALTLPSVQECSHVSLADQDAECRAAVAWSAAQLQQKPNAKLAIVVPELEALRPKLSALLDDVFHPESYLPAHVEIQRCYDFTLGVPLLSVPIISTAISLLRFAWQKQTMLQTEISQLIHSIYWSSSLQEQDARAQLDARMRQECSLSLSNYRFLQFLEQSCQGERALQLPSLLADTQALMEVAQKNNRVAKPNQWADIFKIALERTHWQGQRTISSHEYQAVQSFNKALQELANLTPLTQNIGASEALKRLTQLCKNQIFQAERKTLPAIQIMGMLEASAKPLDGLWVMGMNDHLWPPVARHNALLPADIQRQAKTPNASSEVQASFAMAVHQRLIRSAHNVIFSSAIKNGERALRPSPLMQGIAQATTPVQLNQTLAESLAIASTHDWQWLNDHEAPTVQVGEHVSGGTSLLKSQAICPAWAFYQYRLYARKLDEPANGLDVMERGSLVHAVLAKFWDGRSQQILHDNTPDKLQSEIFTIAETVLATFSAERNYAFSAAYLNLEASRLTKLVHTWLTEVEAQRPQYFDVVACEQAYDIDIEGIRIKLVIDRIDQLDDERLVVIDYKTGNQLDYKNWAESNITEPQLPIYAAFVLQDTNHEVAAVCYARVRIADNTFIGIAAMDAIVQGATVFNDSRGRKVFDETNFPDWQSIIEHWKLSITTTAIRLKNGDASVSFKHENQLAFCDVIPLLRLPERQLQFERQHMKDNV